MRPKGRIYIYAGGGPCNRNRFTVGTVEDLGAEGLTPTEGMALHFWCGDADDQGNDDPLLFEGTIHFDLVKRYWYALIDEGSFRHLSDDNE